MSDFEIKPVVVIKKRQLPTPGVGRLQPLFYEDGDLITSLSSEFPNSGEILCLSGYESLPDEPFVVRYGEDKGGFAPISEDSPAYCRFVVRASNRNAISFNEDYCDILEMDEFPALNTDVVLQFKPTRYLFIQNRGTKEVRGPYKSQDPKLELETDSWVTRLISAHPTDQICKHIPSLREHLLVSFHHQDLPVNGVIPVYDLDESGFSYDDRTFVALTEVIRVAARDESHFVDGISDEELFNWARRFLKDKGNVELSEANKFRKLILEIFQQHNSYQVPSRFMKTRIQRVLDKMDEAAVVQKVFDGSERELLERFAETPEGRRILDAFIAEKEPEIIKNLRSQVLQSEQKQIEQMRTTWYEDLAQLQARKQQLDKVIEELQRKSTQERLEDLTEQHRKIQDAIKEAQKDADYHERHNKKLELMRKALQRQVAEEEEKLAEKLADLKPVLDLLSGAPRHRSKREFPAFHLATGSTQDLSSREYVQQVWTYLKNSGREVTESETVNYLVSILQNRFTIFAGYPGVGKTSLTTLLAKAIGLRPGSDPRRFLKVNVGRGWVSSRDLIGVYNPLTHEFTPADSGLYPALQQLNQEVRSGGSHAPLWVLLDEMNLSPVEHYLSDFIAQADDEFGEVMYGGHHLAFDNSLRFIGTVNYDETTETLSPRMVSRAPVIYMAAPRARHLTDSSEEIDLGHADLPPFQQFSAFISPRPVEFDPEEELKFRELASLMEQERADDNKSLGKPILMEPRVVLAMKRYCSAARELVQPERGKFAALDDVFAQRVLPKVRGSSAEYGLRLRGLKKLCDDSGMVRSSDLLRRIIDQGQLYHEYDFFAF